MDRILYTSHARTDLPSEDIFRIIETSARNNPSREVTGFLIFHRGQFLQVVEGERQALDELLAVLRRDSRHRELTVHFREPAQQRCFPNWRMRRLGSSADGGEEVLRILSHRDLGARCMTLVGEFLTYAEVGARKRTA